MVKSIQVSDSEQYYIHNILMLKSEIKGLENLRLIYELKNSFDKIIETINENIKSKREQIEYYRNEFDLQKYDEAINEIANQI